MIDFDNTDSSWRKYDPSKEIHIHCFAVLVYYIAFTQSGIISGNLFKYLKIIVTARELFKQFGCSERLYRAVLDPLLQVGLFAPSEQCSAAAILGMLNYYIIANQVRTI